MTAAPPVLGREPRLLLWLRRTLHRLAREWRRWQQRRRTAGPHWWVHPSTLRRLEREDRQASVRRPVQFDRATLITRRGQ